MREHKLKTLPAYWDAIASGEKNFEVRRDDRGFQKGDVLVLQKLDTDTFGNPSIYLKMDGYGATAKPIELRRRIAYVLTGGQFGIDAGYVVMALEAE